MGLFGRLNKLARLEKQLLLDKILVQLQHSKLCSWLIMTGWHSSLGGISPLLFEIRKNHPFGLSA